MSGSTSGCVYGWEVKPEESGEGGGDAVAVKPQMETDHSSEVNTNLQPVLQYQAHADAVNGIR